MLRFKRLASTYEQAKILRKYPIGGIIHGYEVRRVLPVPELRLTAVDLYHQQTGAEHIHIDRNDANNIFSIAFKTNPPNATGVPHILEHTTLCGSEKYPVHDPFFKMLNKSLANFMNAMTGQDYTFFPFATTNVKDFANLRDVYLDATLNPLLKREDFNQEGWRLEYSDIENQKSDIRFKGVVYNEMKGQVSNPDYYFWSQFQQTIYPSLNNSGGDPKKITDLMYEDLVDFQRKNYHPSNSKTFTYGTFSLEDTLKRLNKEFVLFGKRNSKIGKLMPIELKEDVMVTKKGQTDPMLPSEKQFKSSLTWICGTPEDHYETFLLKILGNLLMDGQSSIMYKKLIESGLGHEFSVNSGAESNTSVNMFTVGVQGIENPTSLKHMVQTIFEEVLATPFDKTKIEAIIQQIELSKKDQKPDFGLQILYSIIPGWTNNIDPFNGLLFDETLNRFRNDLEARGDNLFYDIIKKYIYKKPTLQFTMEGSSTFSSELENEEKNRLQKKIQTLDSSDKNIIFERGKILNEKQNKIEDLSCLPSLKLEDIPRQGQKYPIEMNNESIMARITDTNGISYIRGKKTLNNQIPLELYPYIPLFVDALTSLGTKDEPFSEIENKIKLYTGGISANYSVTSDPKTLEPKFNFLFSGWALNSKTDKIVEFWEKLLLRTDFQSNSENLKVLIRMLASSNVSSVSDSGHVFARGYACAHFSETNAINESLQGIEQLQLIGKLANILDDPEKFQTEVIDKMVQLQEIIIEHNPQDLQFFITTDTTTQVEKVSSELDKFKEQFAKANNRRTVNGSETQNYPLIENKKPTLLNFSFQTHHTALSKPTNIPFINKDGAALQILSSVLSSKHLHKEIREKNGAYGAGAKYDAINGSFNYFSYRDPNPLQSIAVYKKSFGIQSEDLNDAKLRLFQEVDSPLSRRGEGIWNFDHGINDEMRQSRREHLLDVTMNDIDRVTDQYLNGQTGYEVVVGPILENKTVAPQWNIVNVEQ
ncbi:similar to Saccharomyces cerevisiae YDR430C CYM1 Lysine-specific metalloprotease of the mitochondrial intermembrane space, member of the pitrilysin family [Maudiozyma barnettii]|uniref:Presequence protease, mitochondrial n=1 Tax=Maudiozyma barnettii TaxID=61262 RepID=A0A8H2ZH93_9SACH|nr:Cym1p [Kazachstania barnettii]CAB4253698.1 similar to Saccharomyces cerevisiae YDR430C CYM1 Lysine-specific metalloprotease of the mitochondrial intermembrane space, member of the pitrilysin family [Kazachstania barnettii]CAD1781428.1 similar to Saccharomyces cerevisiae YDR430C CYM1 Lysine-specific metalloprotease of the mitochondrial intermembrane space, member of the pitrilysin family [Kazachstania barnettii]